MKRFLIAAAMLAAPTTAQDAEPPAAPSPGEIVSQAAPSEWAAIAPEDLLVMTLAPDRDGNERKVVIQLMPPPFSQPWIENIRTLAKAHWWDGLAIVRVQDNYVVQWGDPEGEDEGKARALPEGLQETDEGEYVVANGSRGYDLLARAIARSYALRLPSDHQAALLDESGNVVAAQLDGFLQDYLGHDAFGRRDNYADGAGFVRGWQVAATAKGVWPVHCYGTVGVGRGMSPDAGTGAELYTVIGHAPRHLDRNIALVGRVVEGIEHLSSLPRGTGPLGFYETAEERVPIASIRLASELPEAERPRFEFLSTEGETFARYADARANRRDPFFIVPAGGADICNIPVPVRRVEEAPAE